MHQRYREQIGCKNAEKRLQDFIPGDPVLLFCPFLAQVVPIPGTLSQLNE